MNRYPRATSALGRLALVVTLAALGACDGSSDKKFSVGGTASGLTGAVVLQNNGGDNLTVSGDGSFTFGKKVSKGHAYLVTILSKPATQTCVIANGSGNATDNVTNVTLTCTTNASYTVGGSVTGLGSGQTVVLRNNGGDDLTINADGPFTFATPVISGTGYAVTVLTQPTGQTCTVTAGSGTVNGANVNSVAVNCADSPVSYTLGGTISGLSGSVTLGIQTDSSMGGVGSKSFSANGPFDLSPYTAFDGESYAVTVLTQPAGQTCTVTHGSGTVSGANVTNIAVACSSGTALYSIGGTITGLTASGLTLEDNLPGSQAVAANATTFVLPNKVQTNYEYNVGIATQPTGQTCVITKSHGVVATADIVNVAVQCIPNVTSPLVGTYTVPALSAAGISYVYLTFFADGVYIYGSVENNGTNCGTTAQVAGNGVEYGVYNYDASSHAFAFKSAVVDTNGGCGVWDSVVTHASRYDGTLTVGGTAGQGRTLHLVTSAGAVDLVPVDPSTSGQIVGSWGDKYHKSFVAFLSAGGNNLYTFFAESQADTAGPTDTGQLAGIEYACGSTSALTGGNLTPDFTATCQAPAPDTDGPVDTNGTAELSNAGSPIPFTVNADSLTTPGGVLTRIKPN